MRKCLVWLAMGLLLGGCASSVHVPAYPDGIIDRPASDDAEVRILVTSKPVADVVSFYDGRLQGHSGWSREVKSGTQTVVWTHAPEQATVLILPEAKDTRIFLKVPKGQATLDP